MKTWINIIVWMLARHIDPALWRELETLIAQAAETVADGALKRNWVLARLGELPQPVRGALSSTATWLVNLALETLVAKLKVAGAASDD